MKISGLLYRTLHPWEFAGEALHDNVELWDAKWKIEWEEYAAKLCSEYNLHDALCDSIAECGMRKKHAGDAKYYQFSVDIFEYLTQTLQKIEETGNVMLLQDDRDIIQRLKPDEREIFIRVAQQLFSSQPEMSVVLQNLS